MATRRGDARAAARPRLKPATASPVATRVVAMLAFTDAQTLDITGPLEVFALASRQWCEEDPRATPPYRTLVVAREPAPVVMASGLRLLPDATCATLPADVDTLLVSGGMGRALDATRADATLVAWLRDVAGRVRRIASVCNGSLLLAEAGVLDDRAATSHWRDVDELARRYPRVRVVADAIYTHDAHVWTSAGITAGMDLALAMVAEDLGPAHALKVAKRMVMASRRSGGQSQYSAQLQAQDGPEPFARLCRWIGEHLRETLDVERLAARLHTSPRQLTRRFRDTLATTPQKYVETARLEAAKALLETTRKDLKRIAADCGFTSAEAMRRAFRRRLGVAPLDYRARFGTR